MLTKIVLKSTPIQDNCEPSKLSAEFVNQVHRNLDMDKRSEFCSFAQNFLSSTKMSEIGLSENEKRQMTHPQLLKPIPGPDRPSFILGEKGEGINWKIY